MSSEFGALLCTCTHCTIRVRTIHVPVTPLQTACFASKAAGQGSMFGRGLTGGEEGSEGPGWGPEWQEREEIAGEGGQGCREAEVSKVGAGQEGPEKLLEGASMAKREKLLRLPDCWLLVVRAAGFLEITRERNKHV